MMMHAGKWFDLTQIGAYCSRLSRGYIGVAGRAQWLHDARSQTRTVPNLPDSEYAAIEKLSNDSQLYQKLERRFCIRLSELDRFQISSVLAIYASSASLAPIKVARRIGLNKLWQLRSTAYSPFSKSSAATLSPILGGRVTSTLFCTRSGDIPNRNLRPRIEAMLTGRDPGPPGLCRDIFSNYSDARGGSYSSLGDGQGWLEVLLREVRDQLGGTPVHARKRGPKGKARYRTFAIYQLANLFERSGGTVKAYKNPITGKIEGAFIRFVAAILKSCPPTFRKHLGTGIDDAIVRWVQSGRKAPSDGLMSIPLF